MNELAERPLAGLDLNLLVTLRALFQEASVSRAAEVLGSTQPTVSRNLRQLRAAFADPLLVRSGRGMALTPLARSLQTPLEQALAMIDRLSGVGQFAPHSAVRMFRLIMPDVLGCGVMAPLRRHLTPFPGLGLSVVGHEGEALSALLRGSAELVVGAPELTHAELYNRVLPASVPWSVVLGPLHPCWQKPLSLQDWLDSPQVQLIPAGQPTRDSALDRALDEQGHTRQVRLQVAYLSGLAETIEETTMVASLPTATANWLARRHELYVVSHPFAGAGPLRVRMTWHVSNHSDAGHKWFRQLLLSQMTHFLRG